MNSNQEDIFAGGQLLVDARRTGAIPRRVNPSYEHLPSNFQSTVDRINKGERVCVILRGLPGSGKSYLAKALIDMTVKTVDTQEHIISADNFFMQNGRYKYDGSRIGEAHQFAQQQFCQRASKGYSPLIVDNTNKEQWELHYYIQVAIQYHYHIEIMMPETPWAWNANKLAQKNIHTVPADKISFMKEKFEKVKSVEQIARDLRLTLVQQPLQRNIPPVTRPLPATTTTNDTIDLINFADSLDINKNLTAAAATKQEINVKPAAVAPPLTWNAFQQQQQQIITNEGFFQAAEHKESPFKAAENNNFSMPEQIFEGIWDQPAAAEEEKTKGKEESEPQPQRKQQRKNKKSPSSPPDLTAPPHRRNCPNENPQFASLRELYPNIRDSHLWDLFIKTKCDVHWCANLLIDDSTIEYDTGSCLDDLRCDCGSEDYDGSSQAKKVKETEVKKQPTPVKAKKAKNKGPIDDSKVAVKLAIEDSFRIDNSFYPDHVNKVKSWKNGPQASPAATSIEPNLVPPATENDTEDDYLIELPIQQKLINELDDLFGGGLFGTLDRTKKFQQRCLIKRSTAQLLFQDIVENIHSQLEEEKLRKIEDDRNFAIKLLEQDKAFKYPKLTEGSGTDSFKDIMATQQALRDYENDTKGWQVVEKPETIACKLNKEKLYAAFPGLNKNEVDLCFDAYDRNFKETVTVLKDSLALTEEERKCVDEIIASSAKIREKPVEEHDEEQEEMSEADFSLVKRAEELQEDIDRHFEEYNRTKERAREHAGRKEFETASYYNGIASLQKQLSEQKRHDFVNLLAELHANRGKTKTMIDLHYFRLNEAKIHLNTFIDNKISWLRDVKKTMVEIDIITGRGAHSSNGIANLKIMAMKLLQDRNLKPTVVENNAGALKVKIYLNSPLYDELQKMRFEQ